MKNELLISFLNSTFSSILSIALPLYLNSLNYNIATISFSISFMVISNLIFRFIFSFITDKFGSRKTFLLSFVFYSISSIILAIEKELKYIIISNFLIGIAQVAYWSVIRFHVHRVYETEKSKAMSKNWIMLTTGSIIGYFFGGYSTQYIGYKNTFILTSLLSLAIGLFLFKKIKNIYTKEKDLVELKNRTFWKFSLINSLMAFLTPLYSVLIPIELAKQNFSNSSIGLMFVFGNIIFLLTMLYFFKLKTITNVNLSISMCLLSLLFLFLSNEKNLLLFIMLIFLVSSPTTVLFEENYVKMFSKVKVSSLNMSISIVPFLLVKLFSFYVLPYIGVINGLIISLILLIIFSYLSKK
ncbi:MAG: MFS transporter [Candidatus Aenigmarchaeota archaeon]|nr:MFS transporter [Candidatus Aenigmarchaeota archaeon]MDW8149467.1 MFS transporter [Candidatus Aenigmarchaeota archaeon]